MLKRFFFILTLGIFFFSCSNSPDSKLVLIEEDTLKSIISNKESNVLWTSELEGELLNQEITKFPYLAPSVKPSLNLEKALGSGKSPVLPELENFASLDFSNIPFALKEFITKFGESFCSENTAALESFFEADYIFTLKFFFEDMEQSGFKSFDKYIAGRPFIFDDSIKIPFRFYENSRYADAFVCLKNRSEYKVYNIYFIKEEE